MIPGASSQWKRSSLRPTFQTFEKSTPAVGKKSLRVPMHSPTRHFSLMTWHLHRTEKSPECPHRTLIRRDLRDRGMDFRPELAHRVSGITPPNPMPTSTTVSGHEVIDIVAASSNGIRLSQLHETVLKRFGPFTTFHTSSRLGLDFDDLLVFLEARNQLRIFRGVVFPRGARASRL